MARFHSGTLARPLRFIPALGLLVLLVFSVAGCSSDGGECDMCTEDTDCTGGLVCATFNNEDGTFNSKRCGTGTGGSQCRVR
jgi:hypothetical protein